MRALTVIPGQAGSGAVVEMPEPPVQDGPVLVRDPGDRRLRDGHRDRRRRVRVGAAGRDAADPRPRVARPGARGARAAAAWPRRPGGRHRPAARPGPVPGLRRRRVGHVPQRPLHRARHQAARRLRVGALSGSSRSSLVKVDPGLGLARRAAGAGQRPGQGVGAHRADRPARPLGAAQGAGHRRRADRPAGRADGPAARAGGPCPGPRDRRAPSPSLVREPRRRPTTPAASARPARDADIVDRMHRASAELVVDVMQDSSPRRASSA